MSDVTLASLAMDINVGQADAATASLNKLMSAAAGVEGQFGKTSQAAREAGASHGYAGTAAAQSEKAIRGLAQIYGNAFNAQSQYTHSVEATTAMLLQNARAASALEKQQDQAARAVQRLTSSYDPLAGEILKVNNQIADAERLYAKGRVSAEQYGQTVDGLRGKLANLEVAQATGVKSTKAMQQATLNLGRQFTDIGVQLAGGQNPFLVLTQQVPQIIDGLEVAKMQGLGFKQVLGGIGATIAPFLPALIAVGTVAATAFGGAALAARALNEDNKHLVDSLGLTEKQLKHLKDKGVETGVTIGDVFKGTFNYIAGAVKPILDPVKKWFDDLFDGITKGAVWTIKALVGGFAGAFAGIKSIWSDLPAVMGDLFASGANLAISAIEKLLNFATDGINKLIEKANALSSRVNGPQLGTLGGFSLGRIDNLFPGAASKAAEDAAEAVAAAYKKAGAGVDKVFADIGKSIVKAAEDRIKKAAGDAGPAKKPAAAVRDVSEERIAQIQAQIEQATAEELRSRLAITKEISDRANIERQISSALIKAQQARVDAQIAALEDQKGLDPITKEYLRLELERVKFIQGMTGDNQRQAISEKERADLAAEALNTAQATRQGQIDILQSQHQLARSVFEAGRIEKQISDLRYRSERAALEGTAANTTLKASERAIAVQRLAVLEEIRKNELRQLEQSNGMITAMTAAINAVDGMARAFKSGDIGGGISGLSKTLSEVSGLLGSGSKLGGKLGGIADFLGPIGGLVSGVTSLFGGLFGGNSAKKKARAEEEARRQAEEAQRQQTIADTGRSLEITLLRAQGKELEAVAKEREAELAKLTALSPALAEQQKAVYAALDLAEQQAKAAKLVADQRSLDIQLLEAQGRGEEALAMKRADALAALDPSLRATQSAIYAEEDLAKERVKQAEAAAKQAEVAGQARSLQDKIDELTMTSAELMWAGRRKELDAADALDASLGPMLVKFWGLKDAADANAVALQAANDAFEKAKANQATNVGILRELMQLDDAVTGGTSARDAERADYLASLNAEGQYLAKIKFARLDDMALAEKNAKIAADQRGLTIELLEKQGRGEEALAMRREDQLAAMNPLLHATQLAIWAEDDLAAARAKTAEVANRAASIQDQIDKLTMSEAAYLAKSRAAERAEAVKLSASLGPLLDALYLAQDASKAAAEAEQVRLKALQDAEEMARRTAELQAQRQASLADVLEAQGKSEDARFLRRSEELAGISDPVLRALKQQLFVAQDYAAKVASTRDVLTKAYQKEQSALEATRSKMADLGKSLRDYSATLSPTAQSNLDPFSRRAAAELAFTSAANKARLGDTEAMAQIPALGEAFRSASEAASINQIAYLKDLSTIKQATDAAAETALRQESVADLQLKQLKASVAGLIEVEEATVKVSDAIADMKAALKAQAEDNTITQVARLNEQLAAIWDLNATIVAVSTQVKAESKSAAEAFIAGQDAQLRLMGQHLAAIIGLNNTVYSVYGATEKVSATVASLIPVLNALKASSATGLVNKVGNAGTSPINPEGFANGGIFTNGIVSQPTLFDVAQMGEVGPEAIVPLVQGPQGLGVRMSGGSTDTSRLEALVERLTAEVAALKAPADRTARATEGVNNKLGAVTSEDPTKLSITGSATLTVDAA